MRKIGAITVVRNAAKYILPHLDMYEGVYRNAVLYVNNPIRNWTSHYPDEADNTLELVEKKKGIEVHKTDHDQYDGILMNQMLAIMSDCDYVVHFHADVIISSDEWKKMYNFLQTTDADVCSLNMQKCTIDYYYDFDHGARDCMDIEPVASKPTVQYSGFYAHAAKEVEIDWMTVHHFNGWKGITATKDWIENKVPTHSNVYAKDLESKYGGWLKCPEEIRNKFK